MNNPIWAKDWNGREIWANNTNDQQDILRTVNEKYHKNIVFENGTINKDIIITTVVDPDDINMNTLIDCVLSDKIVEIESSKEIKAIKPDGSDYKSDFKTSGISGVTLFTKDNLVDYPDQVVSSPIPCTNIQYDSELSKTERSKVISSELYGHFHSLIKGLQYLHPLQS